MFVRSCGLLVVVCCCLLLFVCCRVVSFVVCRNCCLLWFVLVCWGLVLFGLDVVVCRCCC